jgi:hypothetical protein
VQLQAAAAALAAAAATLEPCKKKLGGELTTSIRSADVDAVVVGYSSSSCHATKKERTPTPSRFNTPTFDWAFFMFFVQLRFGHNHAELQPTRRPAAAGGRGLPT